MESLEISQCSATYVRRKRDTAHIRPPHAAAATTDRHLLPAWPSAATSLQQWPMTDRRTDGRTRFRFIDIALHTTRQYAGGANKCYGLDALPVTQPAVSKHRRKLKGPTQPGKSLTDLIHSSSIAGRLGEGTLLPI